MYFNHYLALFFVCLILMLKNDVACAKQIRICSELNFIPLDQKTSDGKPTGFEIDIILKFAQEQKMEVTIVEVPWSDAIPSLLASKCDLIASGMSPTPERKNIVSFSESIYTIEDFLVLRGEDKKTKSLKKLADFDEKSIRIGVRQGNEIDLYFSSYFKNAKIFSFPKSDSDVISALITNKVDAIGLHSTTAQAILKKSTPNLVIFHELIPTGSFPISYALRKNETELLNSLNQFLIKFKNTHEFSSLEKLYFGG